MEGTNAVSAGFWVAMCEHEIRLVRLRRALVVGISHRFTPPKLGPACARRAEVARLGTGRVMGGYVVRGLFAGGGFGLPMLFGDEYPLGQGA
jgi:hypothetical protein